MEAQHLASIGTPASAVPTLRVVEMRVPDFGRTAADYAKHRAGFPPQLVDWLIVADIVRAGMRVVDLGTGTGSLARLLAERGCEVVGVDIAPSLLEQARRLSEEAGLCIEYVHA